MPNAELEDVKDAILAADKNFTNQIPGDIAQNFEAGDVNVISKVVGTRWDYGHPTMYRMNAAHVVELTNWWTQIHPTTGVVLPIVWKPMLQCYEVNVQWTSNDGHLFNYHVAVSHWGFDANGDPVRLD